MYVQRHLPHLPAAVEVVIFDRRRYNRAEGRAGDGVLKCQLEVSPKEQTRRLERRIDDGRKIWELSPWGLKSCTCRDDDTRARDDVFAATDSAWAPWFVVPADDNKRARLNINSHLLGRIPYKSVPREKIKLPRRKATGGRGPAYPVKLPPARF